MAASPFFLPVMTILLVDDDQDDIDLFASVLDEVDTAKAVTLLTAYDGVEALEVLRANMNSLPDMIFLDVNMPLLNGIETLEIIRDHHLLKDVDITIYTTASSFKEKDKCISLGAKVWSKPTSGQELIDKLSQLINV
jgi:CheY-like chemotaxis protein